MDPVIFGFSMMDHFINRSHIVDYFIIGFASTLLVIYLVCRVVDWIKKWLQRKNNG